MLLTSAEDVATRLTRTHARSRGVEVVADVSIDLGEVDRRQPYGQVKLANLELLNLLLALPVGQRTRQQDFSMYEWNLLTRANGACHVSFEPSGDAYVTRVAVPALTVSRITVRSSSWRSALTDASKFAPYCERRILLESTPTHDTLLHLEASYLGIGVALADRTTATDDATVVELVPAAPFKPERFSGASWKFAEQIFEQTQ
jgi:hypothetical protein